MIIDEGRLQPQLMIMLRIVIVNQDNHDNFNHINRNHANHDDNQASAVQRREGRLQPHGHKPPH